MQLSAPLGVEKETGFTLNYDKYNWDEHRDHFILADCPDHDVDFGEGKKSIFAWEGTEILIQRDKEVQMAAHEYGKGRGVYISGLPYSFVNNRVLYRAILWAAHDEADLHKWFSTNYNVEVHAYVKNGKYCVVNNTYEPQDTTVYTGDGSSLPCIMDTQTRSSGTALRGNRMRTPEEQIRYAASITPSPRQLAWQQLEFYAFTHFGMNTFTNREWGDGTEDPALFNPDALDADQWVAAVKSADMKALILTCKHHDGFCLWPSTYTEHSVKNSPWKNGQGDVVREVSDACRRGGIKFGVYLSPWDRHDARYGQGKPYDDYFVSQLTELATNYGDIFCFWFDGACGEGKNGKKQIYDWERYYAVLRKLQPNAVLNVCGPDVRWCGNEAGHCRKAEWSVVPAELRDAERTASKSQQADDGEFSRKIDSQDEDIGSRAVIRNARELVWYPSEVDTSIRTGWFYHPEEDTDVRTADELLDIYLDAVGANASLLLNIPPDTHGRIAAPDCASLTELGTKIQQIFASNVTEKAEITADSVIAQHPITQAVDGMANTYWQAAYGQNPIRLL